MTSISPSAQVDVDQTPSDVAVPSSSSEKPSTDEPVDESDLYYAKDFGRAREVLFIAVIMSAQMVTQASVGQALSIMYIVGDSFHVTKVGELSWHMAGYSLTVGTFILIAGRLGDMFGHKRMFISAYLWYALWALITGISYYAGSNIFFSACRGLLGIGPSFLMPNAVAILGRAYPQGLKRNMIFAAFGACAPSGFVIGAAFSSMMAQLATWQWTYYLACIVGVFIAGLAYFVIPSDGNMEEQYEVDEVPKFDYLGALLGVSGLILFNVAWNQGPSVGWRTVYVYVLLIIGVLLFAGFVYVETKVSHPLVPVKALNAEIVMILSLVGLGWSTFGIWVYYYWQIMLVLRQDTPLTGSANMSPASVAGILASCSCGFLLHKKVPVLGIMMCAMTAFTVSSILVATVPIHQTYWGQMFVSVLIAPFGMDLSFPAATIMMANLLPRKHQGTGASLVSTVVNYSISIGLGIAGTVQTNVSPNASTTAEILKGYRGAWYTGIGLSGSGVIICFCGLAYSQLRKGKKVRQSSDEEEEKSSNTATDLEV